MVMEQANQLNNSVLASTLVNDGLKFHKQGELKKAVLCYQKALAADAQNSDALHLLGMLFQQSGDLKQAITLIKAAITINPRVAVYHNNLATSFFLQADYHSSIEFFLNALQLKPSYVEAKFNLANSYRLSGELALAEIYYLRCVAELPDFVPAIADLASIYLDQERYGDAIHLLRTSLEKVKGNERHEVVEMLVEVYVKKSHANNETEQALNELEIALSYDQNNELALLAYAELQIKQYDFSGAEQSYRKVLQSSRNDPQVSFNLGIVLKKQGDFNGAENAFKDAVALDNEYVEALFNLANLYKDAENLDKAKKEYEKVLQISPDHYGALINIGVIYGWLGDFNKSLSYLRSAQSIEEENVILLNNLGLVLQNLNKPEEANQYYEKALLMDSDSHEVRWNYSLSLLLLGDFKKGWEYYESRWDLSGNANFGRREYQQPLWKGEWLEGKTIFVFCEQGYGDTLQFCRLLPELIKRGAKVVLECPNALARFVATLHKDIEIISSGSSIPEFDFYSPLLSLCIGLEISEKNIPKTLPYLKTDQKDKNRWDDYLDVNQSINVGIVWAGNPRNCSLINNVIDQRRSCGPAYFEALFELENINFVNLQKEFSSSVFQDKYSIQNPMSRCKDFYDTASLIEQLDLVITVDTAVAHVAGALNKPVWLLSRFDGCWRWLLERECSPWYSSMKIFRQTTSGDWAGVFDRVKLELQVLCENQKTLH